jgi:hypothetical protein
LSTYDIFHKDEAVCCTLKDGLVQLYVLDIAQEKLRHTASTHVNVRQMRGVNQSLAVLIGSRADQGDVIVRITLPSSSSDLTNVKFEVLAQSNNIDISLEYTPTPRNLAL